MGDMNSQRPQVETLLRTDHSPVFFQVSRDGTILKSNSSAKDQNRRLLPKNYIDNVRYCLETGNCIRNAYSRTGRTPIRWDYYPDTLEECVHIYGTPAEITGKTAFEKEQTLFQSFYHAPDAVIMYDGSLSIIYTNLRVTTLLGYRVTELVGKKVDVLFPKYHLDQTPLLPKKQDDTLSHIRNRVLVKKNGTVVELESSEKLLPDGCCMMMLRDNRWRERSQDEFYKAIKSDIYEKLFIKLRLFTHGEGMLMNLNRLTLFLENTASLKEPQILDRFTVATEEFRKIIYPELISIGRYLEALRRDNDLSQSNGIELPAENSISNIADKLKDILDISTDPVESVQNIIKHKDAVRTMINSIKKIIKNISHDIERYFICSPADIIHATVKKYRSEKDTVPITIVNTLNDQSAIMNSSELAGVIQILIDNADEELGGYARQHEDFKPRIDIALSVVNEKIRITIKDNGPGIKKEHHTLLFKDGFTTKGPGHGFGLSYSAKCIQKYGGRIFYQSPPGTGACFVIELLRAYNNNNG